jgi:cyclophilin family peptidyl-prolyl cis-trans isomerase/HEAT repeat protein
MPRRFHILAGTPLLACVVTGAVAAQRSAPVDTALLQRMLVAEDARGTSTGGITPLVSTLRSPDTLLRRVAVRGIGRLQRPDLTHYLIDALGDASPAIRAEAANAVAQSFMNVARPASGAALTDIRAAATILTTRLGEERDTTAADAIAEALGRLPVTDSTDGRRNEGTIVDHSRPIPGFGTVRGLYWIAAGRRFTGGLSPRGVALLRIAAQPRSDVVVRRAALMALAAAGGLDSTTAFAAQRDQDPQVRRLALGGAAGLSRTARATLVREAFADTSQLVRIFAIAAARAGIAQPDCTPIINAAHDASDHVAITAIDALGRPCADEVDVITALSGFLRQPPAAPAPDHGWQRAAHSLAALARIDSGLAAQFLAPAAAAPRWEQRMYAAIAAANSRNLPLLRTLAVDRDHNVRATAIDSLARLAKHDADTFYIRALRAHDNQVLLSAAQALRGSRHPDAVPAILDAFDSISAARNENARDPRVALLQRIDELGSLANATRLISYTSDFDTTIAAMSARTLAKWTGTVVTATPRRLPIRPEPLAQVFLAQDARLKVTMAAENGGGTFTIHLYTNEAPATAARILRLAREHFYDGHVFQRVEPNFVIQGGGPDASEYVGDAAFMRDELGPRSHLRGTLGISSRGRDTGDAQWFFNLVDNTRLDHEYTVFGEVVSGMEVVDRILEGDRIGKVEVLVVSHES